MFEKIALETLQNHLDSYSAKDYFFQSLLCHLASGNNVRIAKKIVKFKIADPSFGSTKECALIEILLQAMDNKDKDAFTHALTQYDTTSPLTEWQGSILLKANKHIKK
eukprot:gene34205-42174_t